MVGFVFSIRRQIMVVLYVFLYLIVMDVSVNVLFPFPDNPETTPPSFLQGYFEYGRSVEGKLDRMMRIAALQKKHNVGYGWIDRKYDALPVNTSNSGFLLTVYGMSHTEILGEAITSIDSRYTVRNFTAPGAPAGWSYAAYQADKKRNTGKVSILGLMTDSIASLGSTSGVTAYFDLGHPYAFPRYYFEKNSIHEVTPPFLSEEGFREYFQNENKWYEYKRWLARNDKFYNPLLFERSVFDASALLRIMRRAYSTKIRQDLYDKVYTKNGFNLRSEEVLLLQVMVKEFARSERVMGRVPVVYIVNNENRGDHLYRALRPILDANGIPFLSTHNICPPNDPRVFTGVNSHFIPSKDRELAKAMIEIIERELKKAVTNEF